MQGQQSNQSGQLHPEGARIYGMGRSTLILGQDLPVVESQRPKRLPLDELAEISVPADRTSVHYRRWLRSLGVTYGTILPPDGDGALCEAATDRLRR